MSKKNKDGVKLRLRPEEGAGASIIVFNTIQQGMYNKFISQLEGIEEDLQSKKLNYNLQKYIAFGPFDNMIRIDNDDFCLVNRISAIAGVSSQQIQCTYRLWSYPGRHEEKKEKNEKLFLPFCCVTQLKVQNHLMLGHGPEIEEDVAGLVANRIKEYIDDPKNDEWTRDLEVELMATLGWDEFFIFMRNFRGFSSMFRPILNCIRPLTLYDLQEYSDSAFEVKGGKDIRNKHLFLTSYSTPAYDIKISEILGKSLEKKIEEKERESYINGTELEPDLFNSKIPDKYKEIFGIDEIQVSTRLSVKPGHRDNVITVTHAVLEGTKGWPPKDVPAIDKIFSIGRYDMYPWLGTMLTCKDFVSYFGLLIFSLAGNLGRKAEYFKILKHTQFYNSFTIISYIDKDTAASTNSGRRAEPPDTMTTDEGGFIKQLGYLALGGLDEPDDTEEHQLKKQQPLRDVYMQRDILKQYLPMPIVNGLLRIFSLFDSCIMDRFTCDSFLDMYPFMKRIREIFDTVDFAPDDGMKKLVFTSDDAGKGNSPLNITLPESYLPYEPLVVVFQDAIERFYRGFMHRYISSYPMMDKNEVGMEYSGRLHRILSAITGMQNLLMDDLGCHDKKGFNVISTSPNIQISHNSFNVTESNIYYLFQVETFFVLYHEIVHTLVHSQEVKGKTLCRIIDEVVGFFYNSPEKSLKSWRRLLEEVIADRIQIRNVFCDKVPEFGYWYWLMILKFNNRIDSQIILRFLVIIFTLDQESHETFKQYYDESGKLHLKEPAQLEPLCRDLLNRIQFPGVFIDKITSRIHHYLECWDIPHDEKLAYFNKAFNFLNDIILSIQPKLERLMKQCCYDSSTECDKTGLEETKTRYQNPNSPQKNEEAGLRQTSSIQALRHLLSFIYRNRGDLSYEEDGIINFMPRRENLRLDLFYYRMSLINTLQWESLHWKKNMLENNGIEFTVTRKEGAGKN